MRVSQASVKLSAIKVREGHNPRTHFDPKEMEELVASVRAVGIAQPILVRPLEGGEFELIAGERRVRAAREVFGSDGEVPALVRECSVEEAEALALVENTERADMSPTEEAESAHRILVRTKGDKDEAAAALGWDVAKLSRRLALMMLTKEVRDALTQRQIVLGVAELLAAVPQGRQNGALEKILQHNLSVAQVKAQVMTLTNKLESAIFDTVECNTCAFNSSQQRGLFGEALSDGYCTNRTCFEKKTDDHLDKIRVDLSEDVPKVVVLRSDSGVVPIKLLVEGPMGVGEEQHQQCLGCQNYGATVSALPGSEGAVEKGLCFDGSCHADKVTAQIKVRKAQERAESDASQEKRAKGASEAEAKAAGSKAGAEAIKRVTKAAAKKADVGAGVKTYRVKEWRQMAAREVFAHEEKALCLLLALGMSGQAREVNASKLGEVFAKLGGVKPALLEGVGVTASTVEQATPEVRRKGLCAMAASSMSQIDERHLVDAMDYLDVDVGKHWKLCPEYLGLLTKSEIESIAKELGIDKAMDTKVFKAALAGKKAELIKTLLDVQGFTYDGAVPKDMQYRPEQAEAEEDGANDSTEGQTQEEHAQQMAV